jgi:hypothetical protein
MMSQASSPQKQCLHTRHFVNILLFILDDSPEQVPCLYFLQPLFPSSVDRCCSL